MRYFKLFDELSPEGDVYRFDGVDFQAKQGVNWGFKHGPSDGETTEEFLDFLVGPNGAWEELNDLAG